MQDGDYPGLFQSANKASRTNQSWHFFCLAVLLTSLFLGAVLSFCPEEKESTAIAAATLFLISISFTLLMAFKRFDRSWHSSRAVAESVKTRSWRYMMRVEPYHLDDVQAKANFTKDLGSILDENSDAAKIIPAIKAEVLTTEMNRVRLLSLDQRKDYYKTHRVEQQLEWYVNKARFNRIRNLVSFVLMVMFQIGALICVVVKLVSPNIKHLPSALFTTLAGIVLSWMQAKRYGELSVSFNLAAHEISIISGNYAILSEEQSFAGFVKDTEGAFSREHTQWTARRGV